MQMEAVEYVFRIDAFSPETLPMARLAEYLTALARMFGHVEQTHFLSVEPGSAKLRAAVEPVGAPKVATRLEAVRFGSAPKDALAAKQALEDLLANDNAVGTLTEAHTDRVILPFMGRDRPQLLAFPPFREDTAIEGQLVSIGGRDSSAHAILQDGEVVHAGLTMPRTMARDLAPLLYGPSLRLHGNGRFERQSGGGWKVSDFRVSRYERLDDRPVGDVLERVRGVPDNGLMEHDAYLDLTALRDGPGDEGR